MTSVNRLAETATVTLSYALTNPKIAKGSVDTITTMARPIIQAPPKRTA